MTQLAVGLILGAILVAGRAAGEWIASRLGLPRV